MLTPAQSTLAESLAVLLHLPYLCLDALSHQPHWQDTPLSIFRAQLSEFISLHPDGWVIDGNYRRKVGDISWAAATDIVWLDYPIYVVLWRLLFRTLGRITGRVELWGMEGCVETWQSQFFSWDSLLYFSLPPFPLHLHSSHAQVLPGELMC